MRFPVITSIKNTSKCAVVRVTIRRRVKHALELIIARGANAGTVTEWSRSGKVPYHELVPLLRLALQTLYAHGMYLEHRWAKIQSEAGHHV